jgi:hypothetical protein
MGMPGRNFVARGVAGLGPLNPAPTKFAEVTVDSFRPTVKNAVLGYFAVIRRQACFARRGRTEESNPRLAKAAPSLSDGKIPPTPGVGVFCRVSLIPFLVPEGGAHGADF